MKKALKFPLSHRHRALGEVERCAVCDWPSATKRGAETHRRSCHGQNSWADRNWSVFYAYREEGATVGELMVTHNLSQASIYRIIQRGIAYPGIYELEEGA